MRESSGDRVLRVFRLTYINPKSAARVDERGDVRVHELGLLDLQSARSLFC
jgi:hypothetical protein